MADQSTQVENFGSLRKEGLAVNTTLTLRIPQWLMIKPHFFVGLEWTNATVPTTPSAGTVTSVKLESVHSPGVFETMVDGSAIDATTGKSISTLDAAGNFSQIEIITTGLTGVDGITLRMGGNRS